jgi:hypothetical protein
MRLREEKRREWLSPEVEELLGECFGGRRKDCGTHKKLDQMLGFCEVRDCSFVPRVDGRVYEESDLVF